MTGESGDKEDKKTAVATFIEQTKLLVTLASAFIVAPAALLPLAKDSSAIIHAGDSICKLFLTEGGFIVSVLCGYFTLATIAGYQHKGVYDVYRRATRIMSLLQIAGYVWGLFFFVKLIRILIQSAHPLALNPP